MVSWEHTFGILGVEKDGVLPTLTRKYPSLRQALNVLVKKAKNFSWSLLKNKVRSQVAPGRFLNLIQFKQHVEKGMGFLVNKQTFVIYIRPN